MKEADKIAIKEKLAQAYCYPETENKEMDSILMSKIAEIIEPVIDDIVKKEKEKAESELKAIKDRILIIANEIEMNDAFDDEKLYDFQTEAVEKLKRIGGGK